MCFSLGPWVLRNPIFVEADPPLYFSTSVWGPKNPPTRPAYFGTFAFPKLAVVLEKKILKKNVSLHTSMSALELKTQISPPPYNFPTPLIEASIDRSRRVDFRKKSPRKELGLF